MTPEQIASTYKGGVRVLRRLEAHGLHVFTDAELRARDERIIRAALDWWDFDGSYGLVETFDNTTDPEEVAEIIAAAEADE